MNHLCEISRLLKKSYRVYTSRILLSLKVKGFNDLRPSLIDLMFYLTENEGASIHEIGLEVGLKKQTMTTHINDLIKKGYLEKKVSESDKRKFQVFFTDLGQKLKLSFTDCLEEVQKEYLHLIGEVELLRLKSSLEFVDSKIE
jgi:DNA-binding MarR family transcriptional regulator